MLKCTLCGIIIHVPYFGGTCWLNFQGDNLFLFHVKMQPFWSRGSMSFLKHQNIVIVLQGLNTQSKTYCKNLRTYSFAWFIVCGTINVALPKSRWLLEHSCPHFAGDPPSVCCPLLQHSCSHVAGDLPILCCPLLQQSHLDSVTYSGTDNYICVVFDKPQKRTLMIEAFSHAAPNFQAA